MTPRPLVVVLGAGPAGLGAAFQLARRGFRVTVHERASEPGGNAGSFDCAGFRADFGSHRLHPSCAPEILEDIRGFLGDDLLDRPRHGRIHLAGRWLHFPLRPADLLLHAPFPLVAGFGLDVLRKRFRGSAGGDSFAAVLREGLGPSMCEHFYFPYARKIWGLEPDALDEEQARRRVAAGSASKLIAKVLGLLPGFRKPGAGRFFYPRLGFGQISEAYREAAIAAGAELRLNSQVEAVRLERDSVVVGAGEIEQRASLVLSTIPVTVLARLLQPEAPPDVLASAAGLRYRSMLLVYLVLDAPQFTEFDAHYFPSASIKITRLSEPRNYSLSGPPGRTLLCAELPCNAHDPVWRMPAEELGEIVLEDLSRAGIPVTAAVTHVEARRLAQAYPIYERGFQPHLTNLNRWLDSLPRVVSLGRQGLFAHDNTHHTLAMAYSAARCTRDDGDFDQSLWRMERAGFESFVVED